MDVDTGLTLKEIREAIVKLSAGLTLPHKRFADEYLANGNNGTQAYLTAFNTNKPRVASVGACKLMKRGDIRSYVEMCKRFTTDELLNNMTITNDRILDEEAKLAFVDMRKMFDPEGAFLPPHYWPEEIARAVTAVDVDQRWDSTNERWRYKYKIKIADKGQALKRLEAIRGMNKMPALTDGDADLFKGFLESIDGETRGILPADQGWIG